jgi:hypothetical protein
VKVEFNVSGYHQKGVDDGKTAGLVAFHEQVLALWSAKNLDMRCILTATELYRYPDPADPRQFLRDDFAYLGLMINYGYINESVTADLNSLGYNTFTSNVKSLSRVKCSKWAGTDNQRTYPIIPGDTVRTYNGMCVQGYVYLTQRTKSKGACPVVDEADVPSRGDCGTVTLDISEASSIVN